MTNKKSTKRNPNLVAGTANIRFKPPKTKDRSPKQNPLASIAPDDLVGGFVDFLRSHTVVTLAVGFVIATQVQTVVKQIVSSFITPTFQFFFKGALVNDSVTWHLNSHSVTYSWGAFVSSILDFIFVIATIYLIIRFFKLDRLEKPKKSK